MNSNCQIKNQEMATLFSSFNLPPAEIFPSEMLNYRLRAEFRVWHQDDDIYLYLILIFRKNEIIIIKTLCI